MHHTSFQSKMHDFEFQYNERNPILIHVTVDESNTQKHFQWYLSSKLDQNSNWICKSEDSFIQETDNIDVIINLCNAVNDKWRWVKDIKDSLAIICIGCIRSCSKTHNKKNSILLVAKANAENKIEGTTQSLSQPSIYVTVLFFCTDKGSSSIEKNTTNYMTSNPNSQMKLYNLPYDITLFTRVAGDQVGIWESLVENGTVQKQEEKVRESKRRRISGHHSSTKPKNDVIRITKTMFQESMKSAEPCGSGTCIRRYKSLIEGNRKRHRIRSKSSGRNLSVQDWSKEMEQCNHQERNSSKSTLNDQLNVNSMMEEHVKTKIIMSKTKIESSTLGMKEMVAAINQKSLEEQIDEGKLAADFFQTIGWELQLPSPAPCISSFANSCMFDIDQVCLTVNSFNKYVIKYLLHAHVDLNRNSDFLLHITDVLIKKVSNCYIFVYEAH